MGEAHPRQSAEPARPREARGEDRDWLPVYGYGSVLALALRDPPHQLPLQNHRWTSLSQRLSASRFLDIDSSGARTLGCGEAFLDRRDEVVLMRRCDRAWH